MSLIFNKENVMESKQMKLEDLIPEMSTMLENALKDKEEIREEIKKTSLLRLSLFSFQNYLFPIFFSNLFLK